MERNADNAGWAFFATVFGLMTAPHWYAQFGMTMLTLVVGLVVTRCVQIVLDRWLPRKNRKNGE